VNGPVDSIISLSKTRQSIAVDWRQSISLQIHVEGTVECSGCQSDSGSEENAVEITPDDTLQFKLQRSITLIEPQLSIMNRQTHNQGSTQPNQQDTHRKFHSSSLLEQPEWRMDLSK
jgi:hypothetical protein